MAEYILRGHDRCFNRGPDLHTA